MMNKSKLKAVVCDIDGVILDTDILFKEIFEKGIKKTDRFKYFYEYCNSNRIMVKSGIVDLLKSFVSSNAHVILSTAREEKYKIETWDKLIKEKIPFTTIYMRKQGDNRPSAEVKREHIETIQSDFDIIAFIDDTLSNCEMAKSKGITALRLV